MNFPGGSPSFFFPHGLQPGGQRAQLIERTLPCQNVAQEPLDLPPRLIGLQKFFGRDVVGILADNPVINDNRVRTNDTQYELWRKALATVLAEGSDIVIADKVVDLGFELDQSLRWSFHKQGPGHFSKPSSHSRKLTVACPLY